MSRVDERLHEAASELRAKADRITPPPVTRPAKAKRGGLLVFAGAFAAVILVFGLIPLLTPSDDPPPVGAPPSSQPAPSTTVLDNCTVMGGTVEAQSLLTAAASDTRQALADRASNCDLEGLAALAAEGFVADFGGGGAETIADWGTEDTGRLGIMMRLMQTRPAEMVTGDGVRIFVWPAAFAYDTWEEIPASDLAELEAIYTPDEIEAMGASDFGAYAGWRIGIDEEGRWLFFVAGD